MLLLACTIFSAVSLADAPDFSQPSVDMIDPNGINLNSGTSTFVSMPAVIGPRSNPLVWRYKYDTSTDQIVETQNGVLNAVSDAIYPSGSISVRVLDHTEVMQPTSSAMTAFTSWSQTGGTMAYDGSGYIYTDRNGAVYDFHGTYTNPPSSCTNQWITQNGVISEKKAYVYCAVGLKSVKYPNGEMLTYTYDSTGLWNGVVRNDGYALHFDGNATGSQSAYLEPTWRISQVRLINLAVDYCDVSQTSCSLSQAWPTASYQYSAETEAVGQTKTLTLTDMAGDKTVYTMTMEPSVPQGAMYWAVTGVKAPSSQGGDTSTYKYTTIYACVADLADSSLNCSAKRQGLVTSVSTSDGVWTYDYRQLEPNAPTYADQYGLWQTLAKRPDGFLWAGVYNVSTGYTQNVMATNGSLFYQTSRSLPNRVNSGTDAMGRTFNFTYDDRGNVTAKQQVATDGTLAPPIQQGFDTVCTYPVKCNKPNWVKDQLGNETDYTYSTTHGGVLTETLPADKNGLRPQKRYTYVQRYAWTKNASGGYTKAASPIWLVNSVSYCRSSNVGSGGSGCTAAGDEVVTTYDYGPDSGPNNLLLRGEVVTADGASHRTCYGYDVYGNRISQTTPGASLTSCP